LAVAGERLPGFGSTTPGVFDHADARHQESTRRRARLC
jgi:hypothetical protein